MAAAFGLYCAKGNKISRGKIGNSKEEGIAEIISGNKELFVNITLKERKVSQKQTNIMEEKTQFKRTVSGYR